MSDSHAVQRFVGETVAHGAYCIGEPLRAGGSQRLHLATGTGHAGHRYLASLIWAPKGIPVDELRNSLSYDVPGVLPLSFVGGLDVCGDNPARVAMQREHWAMLEELPSGEWLPRLLGAPLGPRSAVLLGYRMGEILLRAARLGHVLIGVRPEYVWATQKNDDLTVTGLTGRNQTFFMHVGRGSAHTGFLFERSYLAPEVHRGVLTRDESLVFSLAVMIAEWADGRYPFPDHWVGQSSDAFFEGRHAALDVPAPLAELLRLALKPDPAHRPSLDYFVRRLGLLTKHALTP